MKRIFNSNNELAGYCSDDFMQFYNRKTELQTSVEISNISLLDYNTKQYSKLEQNAPLKRDIQKTLSDWKENNECHQILYLTGARQIGKTTELLKFLYKHYETVIYIKLDEDGNSLVKRFCSMVLSGSNKYLLSDLCDDFDLPKYTDDKATVLFIDEIQVNLDIFKQLRTMQRQYNCEIIVTGSYLGHIFYSGVQQPAGTIYTMNMFPLTFSEFAEVFGYRTTLENIDLLGKANISDHNILMQLQQVYKRIGGYPAVVSEYVRTRDEYASFHKIKQLYDIFLGEAKNYLSEISVSQLSKILREVFKIILNEKRGLDHVPDVDWSSEANMMGVRWLRDAGIIAICELEGDITKERLYFLDCGFAYYVGKLCGYNMDTDEVRGLLQENFAFCELNQLYQYPALAGPAPLQFSVSKEHELDFIITENSGKYEYTSIGIEIKSKNGTPQSLTKLLKNKIITHGVVAKDSLGGNKQDEFGHLTIPIYAVGCRYPYNIDRVEPPELPELPQLKPLDLF